MPYGCADDIGLLPVEHALDAKVAEQLVSRPTRRGGDRVVRELRELYEQAADPAGGAVDEHRLSCLEREPVEQLQRSRTSQRHRGRLRDVEVRRSSADPFGGELGVLGIGAPTGATNRAQPPHRITDGKAVDMRADLRHPACELVPDDVGRLDLRPARISPVACIDRIHAGGPHAHDDVPRTRGRLRQLAK